MRTRAHPGSGVGEGADPGAVTTARPSTSVPSLLKWTGSKRGQARRIAALLPAHARYFEPFLGGGALLYLAARPGSVAGDLYRPLVEVYRVAQTRPDELIEAYRIRWEALKAEGPSAFYEARARFNATPNPLDLHFLMRTCVNGIVRFNERGEFNNSFHLSRPGMDPARLARIVRAWQPRLAGVSLVDGDYEDTLATATARDVVYLDPPYAGSRARYVADLDLPRFFAALAGLNRRGVRWLLSFDGSRGDRDLVHPVPRELFVRHLRLDAGHSRVGVVLGGKVNPVVESLYTNF